MKYMGSKSRIASEILPILLEARQGRPWVEPFVGGGNMIDKVQGFRIGSDINRYVIEALRSIRDSVEELPKNNMEFTESDYKTLRNSDAYTHKGYASFAFSFGAKFLGGWRRDSENRRDYVSEAFFNAKVQSPNLQGVILVECAYINLYIPENSLIYCDPPYAGTTKYKDNFDSVEFWSWCRDMFWKGHRVFVSEYAAPTDFKCVWSKEVNSSLTRDTGSKKAVEKLFTYPNI